MDIRECLKNDHRNALEIASKIAESDDGREARALFNELKTELTKHSRAEEQIVYQALIDQGDDEEKMTAYEGTVEHSLVDVLLERLEAGRFGPKWTAHAKVVKELLEHHIDEEEDEVFSALGDKFDAEALDQLGQKFEKKKEAVEV
ncbi:MAG: hemerythrin domain-containing protein [Burkholderiaceae bacterium]